MPPNLRTGKRKKKSLYVRLRLLTLWTCCHGGAVAKHCKYARTRWCSCDHTQSFSGLIPLHWSHWWTSWQSKSLGIQRHILASLLLWWILFGVLPTLLYVICRQKSPSGEIRFLKNRFANHKPSTSLSPRVAATSFHQYCYRSSFWDKQVFCRFLSIITEHQRRTSITT